jgi:hypothetical protein
LLIYDPDLQGRVDPELAPFLTSRWTDSKGCDLIIIGKRIAGPDHPLPKDIPVLDIGRMRLPAT